MAEKHNSHVAEEAGSHPTSIKTASSTRLSGAFRLMRKPAIILAALVIIGALEHAIGNEHLSTYLFPFQRDAFIQLGGLGLLVILALATIRRCSPTTADRLVRYAKRAVPRVLLSLVVFFVVGEVALRAIYWNGMSFNNHDGPMTRRHDRGFRANRYEDSRGPDVRHVWPHRTAGR